MSLPDPVRDQVSRALDHLGCGSEITSIVPVGGGCINRGVRLDTSDGATHFLKWNPAASTHVFAAEAAGLAALKATKTLRVPTPLAWNGGGEAPAWLLMEFIPEVRPAPESSARLGRGLARIHGLASSPALDSRAGSTGAFGWDHDNWIGALPQSNQADESWSAFWRDQRIIPQLVLARRRNHLKSSEMDRLVDLIPVGLNSNTVPSLLHGDLWNGNCYFTAGGEAVLIDPAVYRGDSEVDLAMTELFGGFDPAFYSAYDEVRPISPEYAAYRRDLYQLYYLLVHVNLFGASYVSGARAASSRVIAALS